MCQQANTIEVASCELQKDVCIGSSQLIGNINSIHMVIVIINQVRNGKQLPNVVTKDSSGDFGVELILFRTPAKS